IANGEEPREEYWGTNMFIDRTSIPDFRYEINRQNARINCDQELIEAIPNDYPPRNFQYLDGIRHFIIRRREDGYPVAIFDSERVRDHIERDPLGWETEGMEANMAIDEWNAQNRNGPKDYWLFYLPFLTGLLWGHKKIVRPHDVQYELRDHENKLVFSCDMDDVLGHWSNVRTSQWSHDAQQNVDEFMDRAHGEGWEDDYFQALRERRSAMEEIRSSVQPEPQPDTSVNSGFMPQFEASEFLDLWNEIMKNMSTGTDLLALWEEEVMKRDQEMNEKQSTEFSPGKSTNQKTESPLMSSTIMDPITSATATGQSNIMAEASAVSSSANSQCGLEELMMDNGSTTSGGQEDSSYQAPESQHIPSMKSMTKRKIEMTDATHLTYTRNMNRIAPKRKLTGAEKMKKHREKRRKVIDREEDWRKLWEDVKEEMELELEGGGTINKGLYYTIGLVIENYPKGKKELSQYRIKIAKRIYTMYRNSNEIDDEIGIYKISREKERELRKLARKQW
ncbi:9134_t:CDS:2, partial [Paraglomus brasilianum]